MSQTKEPPLMEKIVSLCKRRGFIFQSSEIYGGINGFWDYGPLGAELKRNLRDTWWRAMTRQREDVVGLDATIIMHPSIWKASGHVDTFSDPMSDCLVTKKRFRSDHVDPQSGMVHRFSGAKDGISGREIHESFSVLVPFGKPVESAVKVAKAFYESRGLVDPQPFYLPNPSPAPNGGKTYHYEGAVDQLKEIEDQLIESKDPVFLQFWEHTNPDSFLLASQEKVMRELAQEGNLTAREWLENIESTKRCGIAHSVEIRAGLTDNEAHVAAIVFYRGKGIAEPRLLMTKNPARVENSRAFNPENGAQLTEPKPFNLMFHTFVGATANDDDKAYLRPETAQAIFAQFKNVVDSSRQKVPFGICQIGKAFRNEVTPRNFTFRSREFEQMELEFFIKPDEAIEAVCGSVAQWSEGADLSVPQDNWGWDMWHRYWVKERTDYYAGIGLGADVLAYHWQTKEELAHYARACVDILFKFPFGTEELEGIAARGDFDLSAHQNASGKPQDVFDEEVKNAFAKWTDEQRAALVARKQAENAAKPKGAVPEAAVAAWCERLFKGFYVPHVIEPSAGLDRLALAVIAAAFTEVEKTDAKGAKEVLTVMKFHPRIAPVKVGVFPLLKNKPELVAKAREVYDLLKKHLPAFYDEGGSIGKRYARQDEAGTPWCVTIDFDSLGEKGPELKDTVTLRHRDDGSQERVAISELLGRLLPLV